MDSVGEKEGMMVPIVGSHDGVFDGSKDKGIDGLDEEMIGSIGTGDGTLEGDTVPTSFVGLWLGNMLVKFTNLFSSDCIVKLALPSVPPEMAINPAISNTKKKNITPMIKRP